MSIVIAILLSVVVFFAGLLYGSIIVVKSVIQYNANDRSKYVSHKDVIEFLRQLNVFRLGK